MTESRSWRNVQFRVDQFGDEVIRHSKEIFVRSTFSRPRGHIRNCSNLPPPMTNLIDEAKAARENAVAPFSKFKVGAALLTSDGKVFRGCNVENCTYGLTVCAERVALLSALAAGERSFKAICVVTQSDEPSTPCGPCRQLMWEYCGDIDVTLANLASQQIEYKLSDLFPHPFSFCIE